MDSSEVKMDWDSGQLMVNKDGIVGMAWEKQIAIWKHIMDKKFKHPSLKMGKVCHHPSLLSRARLLGPRVSILPFPAHEAHNLLTFGHTQQQS